MVEKLPHPEHQLQPVPSAESAGLRHETAPHPHKERHHHQENITVIREVARRESKSAEPPAVETAADQTHTHRINHELKSIAYDRTLIRVRKDLSPPERLLSTVMHHPVIDAASEFAAKTAGRPVSLLSGSLLAFIGTTLYLWLARRYGLPYNYLVFALLFAGGFIVGLCLELVAMAIRKRRR